MADDSLLSWLQARAAQTHPEILTLNRLHPGGAAAPTPLPGAAPTQADAMDATASAIRNWSDAQIKQGVADGTLDAKTGLPTQAGLFNMAMGFAGGTEEPKLPASLVPKPVTGTLKSVLGMNAAGVLSPESTAYHSRRTSPEGLAYAQKLQAARDLHVRVSTAKSGLDYALQRMREPGLTEAGLFSRQRAVMRQRAKLEDALAKAKAAGVDPDAEFPGDERITAPHGSFPGDDKYAKPSFAPPGYPWNVSGDHQFHDPANWLP